MSDNLDNPNDIAGEIVIRVVHQLTSITYIALVACKRLYNPYHVHTQNNVFWGTEIERIEGQQANFLLI